MSMSGGSLYDAMCRDTNGRKLGSGLGIGRRQRVRHVMSMLSNPNEHVSVSATNSRSSSAADAAIPAIDRPLANVIHAAKARYVRTAATRHPKNTCPMGFHTLRAAIT